jgi:hypothetical protein
MAFTLPINRVQNWLCLLSATSLFVTAVGKLAVWHSKDPIWHAADPVFLVPKHVVLPLVGIFEIGCGMALILISSKAVRLAILATLLATFLSYRLALWVVAKTFTCDCMGTFKFHLETGGHWSGALPNAALVLMVIAAVSLTVSRPGSHELNKSLQP